MAFPYYESIVELIDAYNTGKIIPLYNKNNLTPADETNEIRSSMLIHAYELGFKHATEEEQPDPSEFDSNWEQESAKETS